MVNECCFGRIYWDLYTIVNAQQYTVSDAWDGNELKFTFRRTVSLSLFDRWLELVALIRTIQLTDCEDKPLWLFHPSGKY
jgi:hypothetical protein